MHLRRVYERFFVIHSFLVNLTFIFLDIIIPYIDILSINIDIKTTKKIKKEHFIALLIIKMVNHPLQFQH